MKTDSKPNTTKSVIVDVKLDKQIRRQNESGQFVQFITVHTKSRNDKWKRGYNQKKKDAYNDTASFSDRLAVPAYLETSH